MAISAEEIGKEKGQAEISPMRRDYFTMPEFRRIRDLLPDYELELINGEIAVNSRSPLQYISIADFEKVADEFPDHRIELIDGEITMMPPPDTEHQKITGRVTTLLAYEVRQIAALDCSIGGSSSFFDVPDRFRKPDGSGPDKVCPDASIYLNPSKNTPSIAEGLGGDEFGIVGASPAIN